MSDKIFQGVSLTVHIGSTRTVSDKLSCNECGACENSQKQLNVGDSLKDCKIEELFEKTEKDLEQKYGAQIIVSHGYLHDECKEYPSVRIQFCIDGDMVRDRKNCGSETKINKMHFGIGGEWRAIITQARGESK
ncbi:MAG: hypothetical protein FWG39_02335 [Alphaproteobacteria bacterium]|nr:hypothetical protein [Alphaproteobacteria bacterium]